MLKQFEHLLPKYIGFFQFLNRSICYQNCIFMFTALLVFFHSFVVGASIFLWWRSDFPLVEELFLSFCSGCFFVLLWWMLGVVSNLCQVLLEPWPTLFLTCFALSFGCYFVKMHYFLIVKCMELLVSNKVLYNGVTVFSVYLFYSNLKTKYVIIFMKNKIVLFLL